MPESEQSVAEFYTPIMSSHPIHVQRLVLDLLLGKFQQSRDLEKTIMEVAKRCAEEEGVQ